MPDFEGGDFQNNERDTNPPSDLFEAYQNQVVTVFGMTGSMSELIEMCPVKDGMSLEAKNVFVAATLNEAGVEIKAEHAPQVREILQERGVEEKFTVAAETSPKQEVVQRTTNESKSLSDVGALESTLHVVGLPNREVYGIHKQTQAAILKTHLLLLPAAEALTPQQAISDSQEEASTPYLDQFMPQTSEVVALSAPELQAAGGDDSNEILLVTKQEAEQPKSEDEEVSAEVPPSVLIASDAFRKSTLYVLEPRDDVDDFSDPASIDPSFRIMQPEATEIVNEGLPVDLIIDIPEQAALSSGMLTAEGAVEGLEKASENAETPMLIGESEEGQPTILAGHELTEPYADGAIQFSDILREHIETFEFETDMVRQEVEAIYDRMDELAEQIFMVEQYESIDSVVVEELRQQLFVATKRLLECAGIEVDDETIRLYSVLFVENSWYRPADDKGELPNDPFRERKRSTDIRAKLRNPNGSKSGYIILGRHAVSFSVVR